MLIINTLYASNICFIKVWSAECLFKGGRGVEGWDGEWQQTHKTAQRHGWTLAFFKLLLILSVCVSLSFFIYIYKNFCCWIKSYWGRNKTVWFFVSLSGVFESISQGVWVKDLKFEREHHLKKKVELRSACPWAGSQCEMRVCILNRHAQYCKPTRKNTDTNPQQPFSMSSAPHPLLASPPPALIQHYSH